MCQFYYLMLTICSKFSNILNPEIIILLSGHRDFEVSIVVYYEGIKREVQRRQIDECRCDERLKTKTEGSTRLVYTWLQLFSVCLWFIKIQ
jgi:hypothetical protein